MIVAALILSVAFGTTCGAAAYVGGCGVIGSLLVYAFAGQIAFDLLPLVATLFSFLRRNDQLSEEGLASGFWSDVRRF